MISEGSMVRQPFFIMSIAWIIIVAAILLYVQQTLESKVQEQIKENDKKTLIEKNILVSMDCKSLGNWLIQDNWWDRDNLRWAQNHYLVDCK